MDQVLLSLINCYKNEDEVFGFCNMMFSLPDSNRIHIVINVNSFSGKEDINSFQTKVSKISRNISVFTSSYNLGYLNGMLYGYSMYVRHNKSSAIQVDWVIMSNTDVKIINLDFVKCILDKKRYDNNVVCLAPQIHRLSPDGYEKHYFERYKRSKLLLLSCVNCIGIFSLLYRNLASLRNHIDGKQYNTGRQIYEAHGSFFIIRKRYMTTLTSKVWPCIMYNEEGFISDSVYKTGNAEFYDPSLKIEHIGNTTTKLLPDKDKRKMMMQSYKFLLDIYKVNYWGNPN